MRPTKIKKIKLYFINNHSIPMIKGECPEDERANFVVPRNPGVVKAILEFLKPQEIEVYHTPLSIPERYLYKGLKLKPLN